MVRRPAARPSAPLRQGDAGRHHFPRAVPQHVVCRRRRRLQREPREFRRRAGRDTVLPRALGRGQPRASARHRGVGRADRVLALSGRRGRVGDGAIREGYSRRREASAARGGFLARAWSAGGVPAAGGGEYLSRKDIPDAEKLWLREEVFSRAQKNWVEQIADRPNHRYRSFAKAQLNNAVLGHYMLYFKDLDLFETVYQLNGKNLARSIASIKDSVKTGGDPYGDVKVLAQNLEEKVLQAGNRATESPNRVNVPGGSR